MAKKKMEPGKSNGSGVDWGKVEAFWGVKLPKAYMKYMEMGYGLGGHEKCIFIGDVEFLEPKDMCDRKLKKRYAQGIVPFAQTGRGDLYIWYPEFGTAQDPGVLLSFDLDSDIQGYAGNFAGFLFRMFVAEMYDMTTHHRKKVTREEGIAILKGQIQEMAEFMPKAWVKRLLKVAQGEHKANAEGEDSLVSFDQTIEICQEVLGFEELDEDVDPESVVSPDAD